MLHQHSHAEADGVGFFRLDPDLYVLQQFHLVYLKDLRRHLIAGSPVIHIREKNLHPWNDWGRFWASQNRPHRYTT